MHKYQNAYTPLEKTSGRATMIFEEVAGDGENLRREKVEEVGIEAEKIMYKNSKLSE